MSQPVMAAAKTVTYLRHGSSQPQSNKHTQATCMSAKVLAGTEAQQSQFVAAVLCICAASFASQPAHVLCNIESKQPFLQVPSPMPTIALQCLDPLQVMALVLLPLCSKPSVLCACRKTKQLCAVQLQA
jgi:hypothetical protein